MKQRTVGNDGRDAVPDGNEKDWASFLKDQMETLCLDNKDLSDACGIDRSQVSRWLRREAIPGPDSIRLVCRVLGVDIRYGIVATGSYTAEELRLHTHPSTQEVIRNAKAEMLADELLRRARGATTGPAPGRGTFEEQDRPVIAPILFQDDGGRRNGQAVG